MASDSQSKADLWKERLARFETSGLTVKSFCALEGVSTPSFYYWRKKLQSSPSPRSSSDQPLFQPLLINHSSCPLILHLPSGARLEFLPQHLHLLSSLLLDLSLCQHSSSGDLL